jgi:hypothetical protein
VRIALETIPSFAAFEIKKGSATRPMTFAENNVARIFK